MKTKYSSESNSHPIFFLNKECLLRIVGDCIVISNPRLRYHLEVDSLAASVLLQYSQGLSQLDWELKFAACLGSDRTQRFMGVLGLVTNHSGFNEEADYKPARMAGNKLFKLLRDKLVLIERYAESRLRAKPMVNLLDQDRLGSFHQRVGQFVLLGLKEREPWRAWQNQKFSKDGLRLIGENYRQVQEPFFNKRFTDQDLSGKRILDFGCGNGYFSAKFADAGASVIALDSSGELMTLAKKNYGLRKELDFVLAETIPDSIKYLNSISAKSIDLIYLQDTLLLLLNPESGLRSDTLSELFQAFKRVLSVNGELAAMEPNAIFWLAGRYGDHDAPYVVVTEYRNHIFNVVPNLGEMLAPLAKAGFGLVEYSHPEHTDPTHGDYKYAKEFPIWDFLKFKVINP
jgi:SAM-dependent methyltransferase